MSKDWSGADRTKLRHLWTVKGYSMKQIGAIMGRSRNSVASKISRMGMASLGHRLPGQRFPGDRPGERRHSPFAIP